MTALKKASAEISNKRGRLFCDSVLTTKTCVTDVREIIFKEQSSFEISTFSPYVRASSNPRSLCDKRNFRTVGGNMCLRFV